MLEQRIEQLMTLFEVRSGLGLGLMTLFEVTPACLGSGLRLRLRLRLRLG